MPGLLIVEAMAQTGAVLLMTEQGTAVPKIVYFASLDHVSWPGTVRAGDQLRLEVTVTQARGRLHKVHATASVQGATVCEADLAAVVVETPR
jgi:3-hydroxyacyl-[acyl-carrier-protein] dehydratase